MSDEEERTIDVPEQGYIILDSETGEEAEGILFVCRLDDFAVPPDETRAFRQGLIQAAAMIDDRDYAKQIVTMVGQCKRMTPEAIEDLWGKVQDVYDNRSVRIAKPRKRVTRKKDHK